MKEGYIPRDSRKKILLLCDDIRVHSGIAHMGRELVINTAHHFNWVNLGGAVEHPEAGMRFDLSEDTNKQSGISDSSVTLYPVSGYGTQDHIRQLLKVEKPDAIFLITDPRYWVWLFQMENEIRKQIPIIYLNIWDDYPAPYYNKAFYESCDALLGISKQTVNINKLVLREKAVNKIIEYIPHGINTKHFKPLTETELQDPAFLQFKETLFKGKTFDFVLLFNSRNIRRKQIPDTILAYRHAMDKLTPEERAKCLLLLHTTPVDEHGTDLPAVLKTLCPPDTYNVYFTAGLYDVTRMNWLYNLADGVILLSSNEGWGLSLTEALTTGTPIIANVTGGMQDQMRFEQNGKWYTPTAKLPSNHRGTLRSHGQWAYPVFPTSRSIQGSVPTPYIYDDRCEPEDAADQILQLYSIGKEHRQARGLAGREWATGPEAGFTAEIMGERVITTLDKLFDTWQPRPAYELLLAGKSTTTELNHSLTY
jgi:glycosyltransferase involved in cell wall biosynthesis